MIIVNLLDNKTNKRFEKIFYSRKKAYSFVKKVNQGKNLTLLSIEMEYYYD